MDEKIKKGIIEYVRYMGGVHRWRELAERFGIKPETIIRCYINDKSFKKAIDDAMKG